MMRLTHTLKLEITVQARNGFYLVSGVIVGIFAVLLSQLPADWKAVLPAFAAVNMIVTTFIFVGGLVLLEKSQGVLHGLAVTPLRGREYLAAKVLSLGGLAALETLFVIVLAHGFAFHPLPLVMGLVALASCYTLSGFVVISPYRSVNDYLMPAVGVIMLLLIPLLGLWWPHPLFYLHPLQPMLVLLRAGFEGIGWWQALYGMVGALVINGLAYRRALRAYQEVCR